MSVVELLKMPKAMRDIFGAVRGEYGECLRPNEVTNRYSTLTLSIATMSLTQYDDVCVRR